MNNGKDHLNPTDGPDPETFVEMLERSDTSERLLLWQSRKVPQPYSRSGSTRMAWEGRTAASIPADAGDDDQQRIEIRKAGTEAGDGFWVRSTDWIRSLAEMR
jgi:hypothetical protein